MSDDIGTKSAASAGTPEGALGGHRSEYALSRLSGKVELVNLAAEIEQADAMVGAVASGRLESIAAAIRALQDEARLVLENARATLDLHRVTCRFKKRPGQIYHLYVTAAGERWFSMLAPVDWDAEQRGHRFAGSFRLELDQSFSRVDGVESDVDPRSNPHEVLRRLLG